MAEIATPQTPVQRGKRIHFSWWDHLMNYGDAGILVWSWVILIFLYLPIVVLIVFSFNKQRLNVKWTGFTTEWYHMEQRSYGVGVLHDPDVLKAFVNSIEIAVLSTILAVVIGTLGSFALERFEFRSKTLWDGLNYTKIIIAEVVAGVSTLVFFVQVQSLLVDYVGFDLWGIFESGFWRVLISHVAWSIPFVVVIVRARLKGFDKALEEAGADLGSTPTGVFFRITMPVIAPGILAAALLSFTLSFDDFITTFFVSSASFTTLPLLIWSRVRMGITPEINAISTFMVLLSFIIVAVLELKAHISEDIA
jgi:spermidine/putrescine transport system permease protein